MKKYLFYTRDGYTQDKRLNETENCQIIGFANGENLENAYNNLINENNYILEHDYENITAHELIGNSIDL